MTATVLNRLSLTAAAALAVASMALPARAQTAYDINRLNAAIQVCNSPMGAGMAECAQLRGRLGGGGGVGGLGGYGGGGAGKAAGIAGMLGSAMSAARSAAPTQAAPTAPAVNQQAIADCVRNAAGNTTMVQACLSMASNRPSPSYGAPSYAAPGQAMQASLPTATNGQSYQACVAANPLNWQACAPR